MDARAGYEGCTIVPSVASVGPRRGTHPGHASSRRGKGVEHTSQDAGRDVRWRTTPSRRPRADLAAARIL
eukprot:SAG31_NODE_302_length_18087_cov_97.056982_22_plen_70_part_00